MIGSTRHAFTRRGVPRRLLVVVVALLALGSAAAAGPFREGVAAMARADHAGAAEAFRRAMSSGDASPEWCSWYLAQAELALGETASARARLEMLSANPRAAVRRQATDRLAHILSADGRPYAAARILLDLASDSRLAARARFRAGEVLLAAGDTPAAVRAWSTLCTLHPESPDAHRAVLRILDLSGPIPPVGDYELLLLARSAAAAGDFTSADLLLESTVRRRMDRRIRDDLLILHGDVLLRMSAYGRALEAYREARTLTRDPAVLERLERRLILCRLHQGDTDIGALVRRRALPAAADPEFLEALQSVAALRRLGGDDRLSRALPSLAGIPTFEEFLVAWEDAGGWIGFDTSRHEAIRSALGAAEGLSVRRERALARALLARAEPRGAIDHWRTVLYETEDAWLARRAATAIASAPSASRTGWEAEAERLLAVALRALNAGRPDEALRHLRVCRLGYPGTRAAGTALQLSRQVTAPWVRGLAGDSGGVEPEPTAEARRLLEAGLPDAAVIALDGRTDPHAALIRLHALHLQSTHASAELVAAADAWRASLPVRVFAEELPESAAAWLHPVRPEFLRAPARGAAAAPRAGGRTAPVVASPSSPGADRALLHALAFTASGLDPYFQSGYRLGLLGIDAEATAYARQIPGAPTLEPVDLLNTESALAFARWLLDDLAVNLGETEPHRLAAAWLAGPGFLAPPVGAPPLITLARLPFPSARDRLLRFLEAYDVYTTRLNALVPRPTPAGAAPATPAAAPPRTTAPASRPQPTARPRPATTTPARSSTDSPAATPPPARPAARPAAQPSARILAPNR